MNNNEDNQKIIFPSNEKSKSNKISLSFDMLHAFKDSRKTFNCGVKLALLF